MREAARGRSAEVSPTDCIVISIERNLHAIQGIDCARDEATASEARGT